MLGEEEGQKICFPNKKDRIIQHFKKCPNFLAKTNEERERIFGLLQSNASSLIPQKKQSKFYSFIYH